MFFSRFLLLGSLTVALHAAPSLGPNPSILMFLLDSSSTASDAKILFLHHSTGGVIYDGGVEA